MNKDALTATAIGFVIGLLITTAVVAGPKLPIRWPSFNFPSLDLVGLFRKDTTTDGITQGDQNAGLSDTDTFSIRTPKNDSIVSSDTVEISGYARDGEIIVITTPLTEAVATPNNGTFTTEITVDEGTTDIMVSSFGLTGEPVHETISVHYTKEKI